MANVITVCCDHSMTLVCMDQKDLRMSVHNLAIVLCAKSDSDSCNSVMRGPQFSINIFFISVYFEKFCVSYTYGTMIQNDPKLNHARFLKKKSRYVRATFFFLLFCLIIFICNYEKQRGRATSSLNISYGPPPTK